MPEQWSVVIDAASGQMRSMGTVVSDSIPDTLAVVALSDADADLLRTGGGVWDEAARAVVVPPHPTPEAVEARKLRRWLILHGRDPDAVSAAIMQMSDPTERLLALNEWEYATSYTRRHPLFDGFVRVTGMTAADVDAAFREAAAYE